MRQAFHMTAVISSEDLVSPDTGAAAGVARPDDVTSIVGIQLGHDYVVEHEIGVDEMKRDFQVGSHGGTGIERHRLGDLPDSEIEALVTLFDWEGETTIVVGSDAMEDVDRYTPQDFKARCPNRYDDAPICAAWDRNSCVIRAFAEREREGVRLLHRAFLARDVAIGTGEDQNFGGAGMTLYIVSRLPAQFLASLAESDEKVREISAPAM